MEKVYDSGYRMAKGFEVERLGRIFWNSNFFKNMHKEAIRGFLDGVLSREDISAELRDRVLFVKELIEKEEWDKIDRFSKEVLCEILRLKKIFDKEADGEIIKVYGEGNDGRYKIYIVFLTPNRLRIKTILKVRRWDRPFSYLIGGQPLKNTETWRGLKKAMNSYPEYF